MVVREFFSKLKFWGRKDKPRTDVLERMEKAGYNAIQGRNAQERLDESQQLIEAYNAFITRINDPTMRMTPIERIDAWYNLYQNCYFSYNRIAVPYLRAMDSENYQFATAIKAYEGAHASALVDFQDIRRIIQTRDYIPVEETITNFENYLIKYPFKWLFVLTSWSFGKTDMTPEFVAFFQSMSGSYLNPNNPNPTKI